MGGCDRGTCVPGVGSTDPLPRGVAAGLIHNRRAPLGMVWPCPIPLPRTMGTRQHTKMRNNVSRLGVFPPRVEEGCPVLGAGTAMKAFTFLWLVRVRAGGSPQRPPHEHPVHERMLSPYPYYHVAIVVQVPAPHAPSRGRGRGGGAGGGYPHPYPHHPIAPSHPHHNE